jgi:hypothetical protein
MQHLANYYIQIRTLKIQVSLREANVRLSNSNSYRIDKNMVKFHANTIFKYTLYCRPVTSGSFSVLETKVICNSVFIC